MPVADRLQGFNNQAGQQAGDADLRWAATRWRDALRPHDVIARCGGGAFGILFPDTTLAEATIPLQIRPSGTPPPLTISIGLGEWNLMETRDSLIGRVDLAVHQAKAQGRDRLAVSPTTRRSSATAAPQPASDEINRTTLRAV